MTLGWRTLLFIAADDLPRLANIASRGADAVILDLEDAVPPERKADARAGLGDVVQSLAAQGCSVVVRVNAAWRDLAADLAVAVRSEVAAILVPKVSDGPRLSVIGEMVSEVADGAGMPVPPGLIALVESPAGIAELDSIARVKGVVGICLGTEDFSLELGVPPTPQALDLPCRLIALAAARFRIMALGAPVSIATIKDDAAWSKGVSDARAVGMTGALCVHPRQVAIANTAFSPSSLEIERATEIVAAWQEAGSAGVIQLEGKMVDLPVVLAAKRTLAQASR